MREGLEYLSALEKVRRARAAHPGDRERKPFLRAKRGQHGAAGRGPEGAGGTLARGEGAADRAGAPQRRGRKATGLALIHRSAWKERSAKVGSREFYEVGLTVPTA